MRREFAGEIRAIRDELSTSERGLRADLAASQRQIAQIGWALVAALLAALAALIVALA